jgi:HlyD family secretion protein
MNLLRILLERVKLFWKGPLWRRLLIAGIPAAIVATTLWAYRGRSNVEYYTAKVERGSVSQVVQATGTINAVVSVQVGSQVSGNIESLRADFNSRVSKGQVIAQIEPSLFRAKLMQAEADLATAQANVKALEANIDTQRSEIMVSKANLEKAKAQLFDAKTQAERTEQLAQTGVVSAQQRDTATAAYDAAQASVEAAAAQVEQSQAKLQSTIAQRDQAKAQVLVKQAAQVSAKLDLDHTTIYAPIDGTVIARNVDVGQTVAASLSAPTLFVIAQDLTKMLVYAKTDEADVGRIRVGAEATFRVDSFPREMFSGRVAQVRMNATTAQNVVTYDTIIEFDNPGERLFPGMTAYVSIPVAWANDVIKIPNGALRFTPDISEAERDALYAKYNTPTGSTLDGGLAANAGGVGVSADGAAGEQENGSAPGARSGRPGGGGAGGRNGRGQRPQQANGGDGEAELAAPVGDATAAAPSRAAGRGRGSAGAAGAVRNDWGIVWKLLPDNTLQPVRVRQGVTDFTFTAMEEGDLKVGDNLVIGAISASGNNTALPTQATPLGPGGGRGGFGGGFRGRF